MKNMTAKQLTTLSVLVGSRKAIAAYEIDTALKGATYGEVVVKESGDFTYIMAEANGKNLICTILKADSYLESTVSISYDGHFTMLSIGSMIAVGAIAKEVGIENKEREDSPFSKELKAQMSKLELSFRDKEANDIAKFMAEHGISIEK